MTTPCHGNLQNTTQYDIDDNNKYYQESLTCILILQFPTNSIIYKYLKSFQASQSSSSVKKINLQIPNKLNHKQLQNHKTNQIVAKTILGCQIKYP